MTTRLTHIDDRAASFGDPATGGTNVVMHRCRADESGHLSSTMSEEEFYKFCHLVDAAAAMRQALADIADDCTMYDGYDGDGIPISVDLWQAARAALDLADGTSDEDMGLAVEALLDDTTSPHCLARDLGGGA